MGWLLDTLTGKGRETAGINGAAFTIPCDVNGAPTVGRVSDVSIIDQNADGSTYFGCATPGSTTSSAVWQIRRMNISGTQQIFKYADGDSSFDNVWDSRTALTYL